MNFSDPDEDTSSYICYSGNVATQTYDNADLDITFFRDANLADAASVYNVAFALFSAGPVSGVLDSAHRQGLQSSGGHR